MSSSCFRTEIKDYYWDKFERSVPMSTYLVAFVVANFTRVEADAGDAKWQLNLYARPDASSQLEYYNSISS